MLTALALIALAVMLLTIVQLFRLAWRFYRNEEMEPGGSWGTQLFGRRKGRKRITH